MLNIKKRPNTYHKLRNLTPKTKGITIPNVITEPFLARSMNKFIITSTEDRIILIASGCE